MRACLACLLAACLVSGCSGDDSSPGAGDAAEISGGGSADGGAEDSALLEDTAQISDAVDTAAPECAIRTDGVAWCWGGGANGSPSPDGTGEPTEVWLLDPAIALSTYSGHACGIVEDGSLYCWGANQLGQLGLGNLIVSGKLPELVTALPKAVDIAAGMEHTCAVVPPAGSVYCWGETKNGTLGTGLVGAPGGVDAVPDPTLVPDLTDIAQLAAGGFHTCALRSDGAVFCWGANSDGQCGDGSKDPLKPTPTKVIF